MYKEVPVESPLDESSTSVDQGARISLCQHKMGAAAGAILVKQAVAVCWLASIPKSCVDNLTSLNVGKMNCPLYATFVRRFTGYD